LLLQHEADIFDYCTIENFELTFSKKYQIISMKKITVTERLPYLMKRMNEKAKE